MSGLNCVSNQVPSSLSLHSVAVRPAEYAPGLAALTVRVGGRGPAQPSPPVRAEVRVVHGSEEVHNSVREAVTRCWGEEAGTEEDRLGLGYWGYTVGNTLHLERDTNRFLLALFTNLTTHSWDVVSSSNLTPYRDSDQVSELFTWFVKKNVNTSPSAECCILSVGQKHVEVVTEAGENLVPVNNTVRNVLETFEEKTTQKGGKPSESGYISEEDKKGSKDSSIEKICVADETPDDDKGKATKEESRSKSPGSPDMLAEIENEIRSSMENLLENGDKPDSPTVLVVEAECERKCSESDDIATSDEESKQRLETDEAKESVKPKEGSESNDDKELKESKVTKSPVKSKDGSPKKSLEVQKSKSLLTNLFGGRPLSPNVSKLPQDDPSCPSQFSFDSSLTSNCQLIVELLHQLFCRQWKTVTSVRTEESTLIFLRHDSRILPGLGQQSLSGFSINSEGSIHLYNASQEIIENIKLFANAKKLSEKSCEFSLKEEIPSDKGRELLTEILSIFNTYNFTICSSLDLKLSGLHTNLLLFRPSNVQTSSLLALSLGKGNLLTLDGGGQEEIDAVRETLTSRWPYPIVSDMAVSGCSWAWKVKRYPWRMSYGNKLVDRAVDRAARMVRQISFPPPSNNDLESAKSLVVFVIKELSEKGWKFSCCHNLHTGNCLLHFTR